MNGGRVVKGVGVQDNGSARIGNGMLRGLGEAASRAGALVLVGGGVLREGGSGG